MKNLTLDDFALFVEVAGAQSLSKVARSRQVAASQVSRHFARIEFECQLLLAHRTTHSLSLTDEGEVFLEYAQRMVSEHAQLRSFLGERSKTASGMVRIAIGQLFAQFVLLPRLPTLRAQHPALGIDLRIDDRLVNMADEGIDIAVRAGLPPADTVITRDLGCHGRGLFASPAYLRKYGTPQTPDDLPAHTLITHTGVAAHNVWKFEVAGKSVVQSVVHPAQGRVCANSSAAVVMLALHGAGIARINDVVGQQLVAQGQLKPVLSRYAPAVQYPVYAAILAQRHRAPKIRATVDFLELCFAGFKPARAV